MWLSQSQLAQILEYRAAMDKAVTRAAPSSEAIGELRACVRPWTPGAYQPNDVRKDENAVYKCVSAHDSTSNPGWTPAVTPALWTPYHARSPQTALAWRAPTGAHDMYLAGEYAIYLGKNYLCLADTAYSPDAYPAAWREA